MKDCIVRSAKRQVMIIYIALSLLGSNTNPCPVLCLAGVVTDLSRYLDPVSSAATLKSSRATNQTLIWVLCQRLISYVGEWKIGLTVLWTRLSCPSEPEAAGLTAGTPLNETIIHVASLCCYDTSECLLCNQTFALCGSSYIFMKLEGKAMFRDQWRRPLSSSPSTVWASDVGMKAAGVGWCWKHCSSLSSLLASDTLWTQTHIDKCLTHLTVILCFKHAYHPRLWPPAFSTDVMCHHPVWWTEAHGHQINLTCSTCCFDFLFLYSNLSKQACTKLKILHICFT